MQEPFVLSLEQVVKNPDAYLFVLTISLFPHQTDHSGDSDITGHARTNHLSSSSDADRAARRHENYKFGIVFMKQKDRVIGIVKEPDIILKVVGTS